MSVVMFWAMRWRRPLRPLDAVSDAGAVSVTIPVRATSSVLAVTASDDAAAADPSADGRRAMSDVNRWAMRWRRPFRPLEAVSVAGAVSVSEPMPELALT